MWATPSTAAARVAKSSSIAERTSGPNPMLARYRLVSSAHIAKSAAVDEDITEIAALGSADALLSVDGPSGEPVAAHAGPSKAAATNAIAILRTSKAP
jgi:hypothetical protein